MQSTNTNKGEQNVIKIEPKTKLQLCAEVGIKSTATLRKLLKEYGIPYTRELLTPKHVCDFLENYYGHNKAGYFVVSRDVA